MTELFAVLLCIGVPLFFIFVMLYGWRVILQTVRKWLDYAG